MKRFDILILIALLLSPAFVYCIILYTAPENHHDGWLGYYGTLVGALVTMFVLYRTRSWNRDDNDETRRMQSKMLEFQAKNLWFENFRRQLDENYRILNFQDTIIAVNEISAGNLQKAVNTLLELNKINKEVEPSLFLLKLDEMSKSNCTYKELGEFCTKRVDDTGFIHSTKLRLAMVTKRLLKYEEWKIEQILR